MVRERLRVRLTGPLLAAALVSAPALAVAGQRTITLVNSCPVTVYPGATTGAVVCGTPPNTFTCLCNAGSCPQGQVCDPSTNECHWQQPKTAQGVALDGYHLQLAPKASVNVTIPLPSTTPGATVWSGGIWAGTDLVGSPARTATSYSASDAGTGYCAASVNAKWVVQACSAYTGPANAPNTQAEFTFVNSYLNSGNFAGADFYNVTAINAVGVPMSMGPTTGQTFAPNPSKAANTQYYWCQIPGSVPGSKAPSAPCNWSFASLNNGVGMGLVQHQPNASKRKLCGGTSQACPAGQICGIAYNSSAGTNGLWQECGTTGNTSITAKAGAWSGSWSTVQICTAINFNWTAYQTGGHAAGQVSSQLISKIPCGTTGPASTDAQLLQCKAPTTTGSCYTAGAKNTCCGCPSWPASYDATISCQNTNQNWTGTRRITGVAFPWLSYLKEACPTVYSFQYDDSTSTFTCSTKLTTRNTINTANYTITFCPSGKLAAP